MSKWQSEGIKKIAKSKALSVSDLIRLSLHYFVLNYKGEYSKETVDNLGFAARKKIEAMK